MLERVADRMFSDRNALVLQATFSPAKPCTPVRFRPPPPINQIFRISVITVIEFPCAAILVDAGGEDNTFDSKAALMSYLDNFFAKRTDLNKTLHSIWLTHDHKDHTLGVTAILARNDYKFLNAVTNNFDSSEGQKALLKRMEDLETKGLEPGHEAVWVKNIPSGQGLTSDAIDPVNCGAVDPKIVALWGRIDSTDTDFKGDRGNPNNHSVVARIDFGKSSMLITGDLETKAIESMLRKCFDHVIVLNARHARRILTCYLHHYHRWRTHLSLAMDSPDLFNRRNWARWSNFRMSVDCTGTMSGWRRDAVGRSDFKSRLRIFGKDRHLDVAHGNGSDVTSTASAGNRLLYSAPL